MRKPLIVLDAMGVIYTARDDVAELLIPFARSLGCALSDRDISDAYKDCSLGRFTSQELWRMLGVRGNLAAAEDSYVSLHSVAPELFPFLKAMDEERISVACLSNDVVGWSFKLRSRHQLDGRLEAWIVSGEVGVRKPDAEIYGKLLEQTGRSAEECIFVDDRLANLDAASRLGFVTVHFSDQGTVNGVHGAVRSFGELEQLVRQSILTRSMTGGTSREP
jgi:putative hydrolase of the HAD superfamily